MDKKIILIVLVALSLQGCVKEFEQNLRNALTSEKIDKGKDNKEWFISSTKVIKELEKNRRGFDKVCALSDEFSSRRRSKMFVRSNYMLAEEFSKAANAYKIEVAEIIIGDQEKEILNLPNRASSLKDLERISNENSKFLESLNRGHEMYVPMQLSTKVHVAASNKKWQIKDIEDNKKQQIAKRERDKNKKVEQDKLKAKCDPVLLNSGLPKSNYKEVIVSEYQSHIISVNFKEMICNVVSRGGIVEYIKPKWISNERTFKIQEGKTESLFVFGKRVSGKLKDSWSLNELHINGDKQFFNGEGVHMFVMSLLAK